LREQLDRLCELQAVDEKKAAIIEEIEFFPKAIEKIAGAQKEEDDIVEGIKESIARHEKEKKEKDAELSINSEKLERFKERLNSIKTNTEYQASLKEIDQAKKQNTALEDEILSLMEKIEEEKERLSEAEKVFAEKRTRLEEEKKVLLGKQEKTEQNLREIMKERELHLKDIAPDASELYETLRNKIKGLVVTTASHGTCAACHLHIPPQLINDAMKYEKMYQCPHCRRILYVES